MFAIGEFSKITGLTVKTLRFYHEKGLLAPSYVNEATGYRYYNAADVERARVIRHLRDLGFSLEQIGLILAESREDADLVGWLERRRREVAARIAGEKETLAALDRIIAQEKEGIVMSGQTTFAIEEKDVPAMLIAGIRMRGKYSDCGKAFGVLCRKLGRHAAGKPQCLYYDGEYKEDDADFEPCIPVRRAVDAEGIVCRELPAGHCVSLVHKGPYEELGRSYEKIFAYIHEKGYRPLIPSREVYLKGPGMIFRGNPKNYLTEIQVLVEPAGT
jgi:DNA-binding transcriptional MerR regulator